MFGDQNLADFWKGSDYAQKTYVDDPLNDLMIASVEKKLRCRLPPAYVALMRHQNGGMPKRARHRTQERTSWANDHIAITGISAIGTRKDVSLCGKNGSQFWIDEWGYPPIGVYFADCPSAGHDMVCLDYRACGPVGEPCVVHVDQEWDYKITFVAPTFEAFIYGLEDLECFGGH